MEDALMLLIGLLIGIPVASFIILVSLTWVAMQVAVVGAVLYYLVMWVVGFPYAIGHRILRGRWPGE